MNGTFVVNKLGNVVDELEKNECCVPGKKSRRDARPAKNVNEVRVLCISA
jgi:hypothetical protein